MGCDSHGNLTDAEFSKPLPSIGIYVAAASLICGVSMFADLLHGIRHRKYWFPCKFFSLNATTLTFISVCVKLSLDLNTPMPSRQDQLAKLSSSVFFCVVMANSMPSLGFMVTRDLLMNLVALGILVVTDVVNICIQLGTGAIYVFTREHALVIVLMVIIFTILSFSAIAIPNTKRYLELKYKKKYEFALKECPSRAERRKGVPKLREDLMKFWMMAHTSSPQFVMARSVTCTASGFLCVLSAATLSEAMVRSYFLQPQSSLGFCNGESDYKWSTTLVLVSQGAAIAFGTVAPASRWFSAVKYLRCPSAKKGLRDEMRVESYWFECLSEKKERPLNLWMLNNRRGRKLAHDVNRWMLDVCIATQHGLVLASKFLRFITVYFVSRILLCCLLFTFKCESTVSNAESSPSSSSPTRRFVLHLEGEEELVDYMARTNREATEHLIQKGRKQKPVNLIELLESTTASVSQGFEGIWYFDSDEVPSLATGEPPNCWALPLVTLTSIAVALPNVKPCSLKKLVKAVNEALVYVKKFEDVLDIEGELANSRKAAEVVWLGVDLYHKWLNVDLRKLSKQEKTTTQVLEELVDIAKREFTEMWQKNLIYCMKHKPSHWPIKTLAANSMYRISQTLLNKYESRDIGTEEEMLLKDVERMVSDIVAGCFCNAAQVIGMKCLVTAVEVREASVREAAMHLGRTEKILEIVDRRCMPALSHHEVAKIDGWREFYRTNNRCISLTRPSSQCTTRDLILNLE
ncbi:Transmembrane protein [Hirschfeldia incana]|nr:Transmembrane protein [Hirschfeldia incana]